MAKLFVRKKHKSVNFIASQAPNFTAFYFWLALQSTTQWSFMWHKMVLDWLFGWSDTHPYTHTRGPVLDCDIARQLSSWRQGQSSHLWHQWVTRHTNEAKNYLWIIKNYLEIFRNMPHIPILMYSTADQNLGIFKVIHISKLLMTWLHHSLN